MRLRRNKAPARHLPVLLCVLIAVGLSGDLVVCFAADGHVEIEQAHGGDDCRTEANRHHDGRPDREDCDPASHACSDLVLPAAVGHALSPRDDIASVRRALETGAAPLACAPTGIARKGGDAAAVAEILARAPGGGLPPVYSVLSPVLRL